MEHDIREEIISGFCRSQNQGRTVTCELKLREDGWKLIYADCGYESCIHTGGCQVARQIREIASEKPEGGSSEIK